jgi:hypothetical protein
MDLVKLFFRVKAFRDQVEQDGENESRKGNNRYHHMNSPYISPVPV